MRHLLLLATLAGCSRPIDPIIAENPWAPGAQIDLPVDTERARNWTAESSDPEVVSVIGKRSIEDGAMFVLQAGTPGEAEIRLLRSNGSEADAVRFRVAEAEEFLVSDNGFLTDEPYLLVGTGDSFEVQAFADGRPLCGAYVYGDAGPTATAPEDGFVCDNEAQVWLTAYFEGPQISEFGTSTLVGSMQVNGILASAVNYQIVNRMQSRTGTASTRSTYLGQTVFGVSDPVWQVDDETVYGIFGSGPTLEYTVDPNNMVEVTAQSGELSTSTWLPIAEGSASVGCMTLPAAPLLVLTVAALVAAPRRRESNS